MDRPTWTLTELVIAHCTLRVRDLGRALAFYRDLLGLVVLASPERGVAELGTEGGTAFLELVADAAARPRPRLSAGLYHVAILFPDRPSLGRAFRRLASAGWPFHGFADHLVSEALYLPDPDGNGLELYVDRPRAGWRWQGDQVAMATLPLDLESLAAAADEKPEGRVPPGTGIGHIHLHVGDLAAAEAFFASTLHLEVTARNYPGALFFAAGRYHHHFGANIWAGRGVRPAEDSVGLVSYTLLVKRPELERLLAELPPGRMPTRRGDETWELEDPSGSRVLLRPKEGWSSSPLAQGSASNDR